MTTNTESIVVEATYTVDRSAVWAAITDAERMSQWYFEPIAAFRPEVGSETQFTVHSQGKDWVHLWRVTEVVPEVRIAYTFNYAGYEGDASVLWELSDVAVGTRLRLTHTGIETYPRDEPAFQREVAVAGWTYFLQERLRGFLEPQRSPIAPAVDKVIHVSVFVAVPPAKAFEYFTDATLLQRWLTGVAEVEARPGGKYELFWQPDDRENNSTIGWRSSPEWEEARAWQEKAWRGAFEELNRVARA